MGKRFALMGDASTPLRSIPYASWASRLPPIDEPLGRLLRPSRASRRSETRLEGGSWMAKGSPLGADESAALGRGEALLPANVRALAAQRWLFQWIAMQRE